MHANTLDQLESSKLTQSVGSQEMSPEIRKKIDDCTIHNNTAYVLNQVGERMIHLNNQNEKLTHELQIHRDYMRILKRLERHELTPCDHYQDELNKDVAHLAYKHRQRQNEIDREILGELKEIRERAEIQAGQTTRDEFDVGAALQGKKKHSERNLKTRKLVSKKKRK